MSMDRAVLADLEAIVGTGHIRHDRGDVEPYTRDATPAFRGVPDVIVWPRTAAEIGAIMRLATQRRIPVVPRGAGSNLCAATVPLTGGIVLVLTRMNRILEVNAEELLARAETGVPTTAVSDAAAQRGLLYAPDPGSRTVSTIGGNVATCAGGLRGLKYGVTRNYVLGLEVVLPTGEVIRTGGRLWKDVAGYDLTRLLTGAEGTLGVITEVTVALLPMPATTNTGLAYFPTLSDAGRAVTAVIADGIVPATLEFLDATVPRPRLAEMVDRINEIAERHQVLIATFGHAGDGNLHPTCVVDQHDAAAIERAHKAFADIFAAAIDMGGTITGEHGVGAAKLPYLSARLGADQVALLRRIKAAFDPAGILNPGKLGS